MKRRGCTGCALLEQFPGQWVNGLCPGCAELAERHRAPARPVSRDETADRLRGYLTGIAERIPGLWKDVDNIRSMRGNKLPSWPPWCFLPLTGAYAIVSDGSTRTVPDNELPMIGTVGALAAWRVTQGIYRYDQTVLDALWATPVTGDIPEQVLQSIPEWCVYIETPGRTCGGTPILGYFAHLEWDANTGRHELRLMADDGGTLFGLLAVHLGAGLSAGIESALREAEHQIGKHIREPDRRETMMRMVRDEARFRSESLAPMVSTLLYLCAANAEVTPRGPRRPKPAVTRTKDGPRIFPPDQPMVWEVGYRIGATIRGARAAQVRRRAENGTHASPVPHIRRSHWHSFWTGEKARLGAGPTNRQLKLKWLPPIPVNFGEEESDVIPTIHHVV